jgi:hypothetical protein
MVGKAGRHLVGLVQKQKNNRLVAAAELTKRCICRHHLAKLVLHKRLYDILPTIAIRSWGDG